jgi:hypothetical protein
LAVFSCINIDNTIRLYDDLEVICYSDEHKKYAFGIALPAIILWSIGIPAFGFLLLGKQINKG